VADAGGTSLCRGKRRSIGVSAVEAPNKAILAFSAHAALHRAAHLALAKGLAACFGINHLRWPMPAAHPCAAGETPNNRRFPYV